MVEPIITFDDQAFRKQLSNLERAHLPAASAIALNDTAYDALKFTQERMDVVFDRPTRWTKNALMVWRATKDNLEAKLQERPSVGRKHYLKVQEAGGTRPQTGVEKLLASQVGYRGSIAAAIPAAGAKLDASGNWSSGERNQVLSALGAQRDTSANQTDSSRKRAKGRASYFVPKQGLPPGVWKRTQTGDLSKVLTFTTAMPSYTQRFGFYDGVQEVWEAKLPDHLERALAKAVFDAR